jgi:NAD+ kinase
MPGLSEPVKRIAVAAHPQLPEAIRLGAQIATALEEQGLVVDYGLLYDDSIRQSLNSRQAQILIALGGDGTMLRAGHLCGPVNIPILGINVGHFGFLVEIKHQHWQEMLPRLLEGDYWLERRMMLLAEHIRSGQCISRWEVLNDVVVSRGQMVRPVHLAAQVDGRYLATYVADALIVATATGSTAYAMAAGGPILSPELRNILLVPVAPHLSIEHAIVLAEGASVTIRVVTDHQAVVSPDGQTPITMEEGDQVDVHACEHTVQFIRFQDPGYFYRNLTPHMSKNPSTGEHR